jgi:alkylation response protein AidB-like acyl-CoA dehydrogenase
LVAITRGLTALAALTAAAPLTAPAADRGRPGAVQDLMRDTLAGTAVPMFTGSSALEVAERQGRLNGVIRNVLDVDHASHLLVPFDRPGAAVALVALPHPGITLKFRPTWDMTRRLFDVVLDGVLVPPGDVLFEGAGAESVIAVTVAQFDLAIACDAVGGAEAIFADTLEYMLVRRQFDRPIASFQALKHRCADLRTRMEASSALVSAASHAFSEARHESPALGVGAPPAACARLHASRVYREVTEEAIQLHGGIGFTWEHRCHRFLKRARLNDVLNGTPEQRKDAVAPALFRAAADTAVSPSAVAFQGGRTP